MTYDGDGSTYRPIQPLYKLVSEVPIAKGNVSIFHAKRLEDGEDVALKFVTEELDERLEKEHFLYEKIHKANGYAENVAKAYAFHKRLYSEGGDGVAAYLSPEDRDTIKNTGMSLSCMLVMEWLSLLGERNKPAVQIMSYIRNLHRDRGDNLFPLDVGWLGLIIRQLAQMLLQLETAGVVHSDFHIGNVLLQHKPSDLVSGAFRGETIGQFVKLIDLDRSRNENSRTAPVGIPDFLSPQKLEGKPREVCSADDIFAVGTLIYLLFTGRGPTSIRKKRTDSREDWELRLILYWNDGGSPRDLFDDPKCKEMDKKILCMVQRMCAREESDRPEVKEILECFSRPLQKSMNDLLYAPSGGGGFLDAVSEALKESALSPFFPFFIQGLSNSHQSIEKQLDREKSESVVLEEKLKSLEKELQEEKKLSQARQEKVTRRRAKQPTKASSGFGKACIFILGCSILLAVMFIWLKPSSRKIRGGLTSKSLFVEKKEQKTKVRALLKTLTVQNGAKEVKLKVSAIPAGCFLMGSPDGKGKKKSELGRRSDEKLHKVCLTKGFEMAQHEVTQKLFEDVMGYNLSFFKKCPNCPVENVGWHEAVAFTNQLSKLAKKEACYICSGGKEKVSCKIKPKFSGKNYYHCKGYRLPTEAEWEYAYRSGTQTAFYNGAITSIRGKDENLDKIAWYRKNSGSKTHPVGLKTANAFGLHDMTGNVWEWTYDLYNGEISTSRVTPDNDPVFTKTRSVRMIRGGSWYNYARRCRAADRGWGGPGSRFNYLGFRFLRSSDKK